MQRPRTTRRQFMGALALCTSGAALSNLTPIARQSAAATDEFVLKPQPASARIAGAEHPATDVWAYNGTAPGPEIRVPVGQPVRIRVENGLEQDTTVHWHGLRLPNAMDGVPGLTQPPIKPGESFVYEFTPPDAGTFWYHPHVRGFEQVDRGLAGALIVEEAEPMPVDREVTWVLDDWRLTEDAAISDDFGNGHDLSHAGRIGNVVTINGQVTDTIDVRAGERIRLRLVNVSNARNFALTFGKHRPRIIAIDGQPVEPHEPDHEYVVVAAAGRVDLLLDCTEPPESSVPIVDKFYRNRHFDLTTIRYTAEPPLPARSDDDIPSLGLATIPEPDVDSAETLEVVLGGGAMGGMRGATLDGEYTDIRTLARQGLMWAINGAVRRPEQYGEPLLSARLGASYRIVMRNESSFPHPMHLHGHHFRVLSRNGHERPRREWRDTVLVLPRDEVVIAFKADNPGDWLFHCHVLEHMAAGMSSLIRVS